MQQELIATEKAELPLAIPSEELNLMAVIARAASDPNINVNKMERLLQMRNQLQKEKAEREFTEAMNLVQRELPRIKKNGAIEIRGGTKIRYAKYEDIHDAVNPLLLNNGFAVSYTSEVSGQALLRVTVTVKHIGGHSDGGSVFVPISETSGAKNSVQGTGSVLSYGKRYALCQYLNIVTDGEDDDGTKGETQPITQAQVNNIRDMMIETSADEGGFLRFMAVERVEDIMVRDFSKAMKALEDKRRKQGRRA